MKKDTFLYISAFLMDSCFAIVGVCVPLHALQFGATYDDLGWINTCGAFAYSLTSLVSGRLSDRMGYRPVMTIACIFLVLAFVGYLGVNRIWHFVVLSVLVGVAIAHYWPPDASLAWAWEISRQAVTRIGAVQCGVDTGRVYWSSCGW